MSGPVQINVSIDAARTGVVLSITQHGNDLAFAELTTPDLEDLLHMLANVRAQLAEQVPTTLDRGTRKELVVDEGWSAPANPHPDGKAFALRHPGFGWLGFLFGRSEAEALGTYLLSDDPQR